MSGLQESMLASVWARVTRPGYSESSAERRRAWAIHAYTGANAGGKTLAMVHDTLPSLRLGRPVLSTVRLLDFDHPRPCEGGSLCDDPEHHETSAGVHPAAHPSYVPFRDFRQLLQFSFGDVLMDEVTGVASSRESHGLPVQVVNLLMQLRRSDILLRYTTPNFARADKVLREVTQALTDCASFYPVTARKDGTARVWRERRLFRWVTFDAFAFETWTVGKRDQLLPLHAQWFWRPGSMVQAAYATLDPVLALGVATEAGMCLTCGGRRAVPRCSCSEPADVGAPLPVRVPRSGRHVRSA